MASPPRYSVDDLKAYIDASFEALSSRDPTVVLREFRGRLAEWEADWFIRGARDLGVFDVEVHECTSGFVAAGLEGMMFLSRTGKPRDGHFFEVAGRKGQGGRRVSRESITHLAAMAMLVGEYGHPADSILSQSDRFEVDIVAFDRPVLQRDALLILGVEVKVNAREHEALAIGMQACGGEGGEDAHRDEAWRRLGWRMSEDKARNHHKKCRWLAKQLPGTFWVVSSERSNVFAVEPTSADGFEMIPLGLEGLKRSSVEERTRPH